MIAPCLSDILTLKSIHQCIQNSSQLHSYCIYFPPEIPFCFHWMINHGKLRTENSGISSETPLQICCESIHFLTPIFTESLACARHYSRSWGFGEEEDKSWSSWSLNFHESTLETELTISWIYRYCGSSRSYSFSKCQFQTSWARALGKYYCWTEDQM